MNGDVGRIEQIVGCGIEWMESVASEVDETWLMKLDPPYPRGCRASSRSIYEFEMNQKDHQRLLTIAKRLKCHVMICSYSNPLYNRRLKSWHLETRWAMTRRGPALEHCWLNFDPETVPKLPTLSRAPDFRERERVKKKARRWVGMLNAFPDYERDFILEQISRCAGI
jgi:hypothetical protein